MKERFFDRDGQPIGFERWMQLYIDVQYTRVAYDDLPDGGFLSTAWLGLDHSTGEGPPRIFETMAFPRGGIRVRYATLEEARAGHARILAELTGGRQ